MGVFQRQSSSASVSSSTSKASDAVRQTLSRSSSMISTKSPKPTKPSLVQRVSSSVKPRPKPQPSLLRRATTGLAGLGDVSTTRWEKRMLKRIENFPKDHPLLVKVVGAGLCLAGAGAGAVGAVGIPAIAAALGIKMAVVGGTATMSALGGVAATAGVGVAAQGTAVAGIVAAGAKILFSTAAVDVGRRMIESTEARPKTFLGSLGFRNRSSSSNGLSLMPLSKDDRSS